MTLFRFQSGNAGGKRDAAVEATLEHWGDDSWQLAYRWVGENRCGLGMDAPAKSRRSAEDSLKCHTQTALCVCAGATPPTGAPAGSPTPCGRC